nr:hypothetical protein [Tanacetum cinerariifolium]
MSTSTHPIIILSNSEIEDAFSSTNTPDYTPASSDYSSASPRNAAFDSKTESDPSEDPFDDHSAPLNLSPSHDDPCMKVMQAYNATSNKSPIPPAQAPITPPTVLPPSPIAGFQREQIRHDDEIVLAHVRISTLEMLIEDIKHMIPPTPPRDTEPPIGSPISLSPSSSVGSSSSVRSNTPPSDYPFDESILAELDNSLWIIARPQGTLAMNQAAIRKLVADSVVAALEAQAATMANTDNTNRTKWNSCSKKI